MHERATIRVADRTDLSGRAAADEVNLDRFHNRIRKVCDLVAATLILPAAAYAKAGGLLATLMKEVLQGGAANARNLGTFTFIGFAVAF